MRIAAIAFVLIGIVVVRSCLLQEQRVDDLSSTPRYEARYDANDLYLKRPGARLTGRVVGAGGGPVSRVWVYLQYVKKQEPDTTTAYQVGPVLAASGDDSVPAGTFIFHDIPEEAVRLVVTSSEPGSMMLFYLDYEGGDQTLDLGEINLATIHGQTMRLHTNDMRRSVDGNQLDWAKVKVELRVLDDFAESLTGTLGADGSMMIRSNLPTKRVFSGEGGFSVTRALVHPLIVTLTGIGEMNPNVDISLRVGGVPNFGQAFPPDVQNLEVIVSDRPRSYDTLQLTGPFLSDNVRYYVIDSEGRVVASDNVSTTTSDVLTISLDLPSIGAPFRIEAVDESRSGVYASPLTPISGDLHADLSSCTVAPSRRLQLVGAKGSYTVLVAPKLYQGQQTLTYRSVVSDQSGIVTIPLLSSGVYELRVVDQEGTTVRVSRTKDGEAFETLTLDVTWSNNNVTLYCK